MLCFLFSALVVMLDQLFKHWITITMAVGEQKSIIPGVISLAHVENYGAAFSILSGKRWLLAAIMFVAIIVIIAILLRYNEGFWGTLGLSAVLGGAVGNLIDRVFNGHVVDMFEFKFIDFAIFNIADIFITLGGITFLIFFIVTSFRPSGDADARPDKKRGAAARPVDYEDEQDDDGYDYGFEDDDESVPEPMPYLRPVPSRGPGANSSIVTNISPFASEESRYASSEASPFAAELSRKSSSETPPFADDASSPFADSGSHPASGISPRSGKTPSSDAEPHSAAGLNHGVGAHRPSSGHPPESSGEIYETSSLLDELETLESDLAEIGMYENSDMDELLREYGFEEDTEEPADAVTGIEGFPEAEMAADETAGDEAEAEAYDEEDAEAYDEEDADDEEDIL